MARRVSKHLRPHRPLRLQGITRVQRRGQVWEYHPIPANHSQKEYRCPFCQQTIKIGQPHIVAWPQEPPFGGGQGSDYRRHWHTPCWKRDAR